TLFIGGLLVYTQSVQDTPTATSSKEKTHSKKKVPKKKKRDPQLPKVKTSDWNLLLVNEDHPLEKDFELELTELDNGQQIDQRMAGAYQELKTAAEAENLSYVVISGYRTIVYQQELLNNDIASYQAQGYSADEAKEK